MSTPRHFKYFVCCLTICLGATGCNWITRVNTSADGENGSNPGGFNWGAVNITLSANGRYAVFSALDSNLVTGDTNDRADVFRKDLLTGAIIRVSVGSDGTQGDRTSGEPSVSADGRYVLFSSRATNLVTNDNNGVKDVFLHDTVTGITTRESVASDGSEGSKEASSIYQRGLSADGRWIAFSSESPELAPLEVATLRSRVFLRDTVSGTTIAVGVNGADIEEPDVQPGSDVVDSYTFINRGAMSSDGRYLLVNAGAVKIIATGGYPMTRNVNNLDSYIYDHQAGIMHRVSDMVAEGELPEGARFSAYAMSPDGRFVLLSVLDLEARRSLGLLNVQTGAVETVSQVPSSVSYVSGTAPIVSADNRFVMFSARDAAGVERAYVRDTHLDRTVLVGAGMDGTPGSQGQGSFAFSSDGRYVGFCSYHSDTIIPDNLPPANSCYVRAFPSPTISAVTPSHIPKGGTRRIIISGDYFLPGVFFHVAGAELSNVIRVDEHTVSADIEVPLDASTGNQSLLMFLPGTGAGGETGSAAACNDCITFF